MSAEPQSVTISAFAKIDAVLGGVKLGFNNALSFLHIFEMHFTSQADLMSHIAKGDDYIDHVKESESALEDEVLQYMFEVDTLERKKTQLDKLIEALGVNYEASSADMSFDDGTDIPNEYERAGTS